MHAFRLARRVIAFLSGGSFAGLAAIHAIHLAAGSAIPAAYQFLCHIAR
jgi:hypothetical protein